MPQQTMQIPVRLTDREVLSAATLNRMQEELLRQLLTHTHSGADGAPLGPEGIAPGAIQSKHLGPIGLGPDQIAPGAVGATQLAEHVVAGHHLATGAVPTEALAAHAVTLEKLAKDVLGEIKKPRGATTYGWCAYLDPALLYPAPAGQPWYEWLLDANLPLPAPKVTLLEAGRPLPFLLGASLDATPPVQPKGPPEEPRPTGEPPGEKPIPPTFEKAPPIAPDFARPAEPMRPVDPAYEPPGAPPQPDVAESAEPRPNEESQEIARWLRISPDALDRQLDDRSVPDKVLGQMLQEAWLKNVLTSIDRVGSPNQDFKPLLGGLLKYRRERWEYWESKAAWEKYRTELEVYKSTLAEYERAYKAEQSKIDSTYAEAMKLYQEQLGAWTRYDDDYAAFTAAQSEYEQAKERYQTDLNAWEERSASFHKAEGEYEAKREEYERLKAEYDAAMARYQAEKEGFVARIQPPEGFPTGELRPQRFELQVEPTAIGWLVSPVGPQRLRPALITNEPFTTDVKPVALAPGQRLDESGRSLIARIAYAFGLPEEIDPVQRMSARLFQFLNTPGFLLGGYLGELRNVRSIARMREGESRFVRICFERPYPAATYTVSVTPDGRPGAPVPQPFVWRQTPTYVDLCFQVGSELVDTLAFRFAIHGELSES